MRELNIDRMETVTGGGNVDCAVAIAEGTTAVFGLAAATASTGVLAPLGVGIAIVGLGFLVYNTYKNGDPC
jgi:hypothetical protein